MKSRILLVAAALVSCSKSDPGPVPAPSGAASAAPAPIDTKAQAKTWLKLMLAGVDKLGIQDPIARYNADTDPNHMLGRAHGYADKIAWRVAGGDASLELFADPSDADARQAYLDGITKASPMLGDGYDYRKGGALLRLPRALTPAQAAAWKALLDQL